MKGCHDYEGVSYGVSETKIHGSMGETYSMLALGASSRLVCELGTRECVESFRAKGIDQDDSGADNLKSGMRKIIRKTKYQHRDPPTFPVHNLQLVSKVSSGSTSPSFVEKLSRIKIEERVSQSPPASYYV